MANPAQVILSTDLNGTNGVRIDGGTSAERLGRTMVPVGDINGDGHNDFIIGTYQFGTNRRGGAYVVFGGPTLSTVSQLSDLNGTNGFKLLGEYDNSRTGWAVGGVDDFNGDGIDDILIGGELAPDGNYRGVAYIVFGAATFAPTVSLAALDGNTGFQFSGVDTGGQFGFALSGIDDFNGDGRSDIIVSARGADRGASNSGSIWILFGRDGPYTPDFSVAVNAATGLRFDGGAANVVAGSDVIDAGDINNDGFSDVLIMAAQSSQGFLVFGRAGNSLDGLQLTSLDGSNGFKVNLGTSGDAFTIYNTAARAGDINGDGYDDLIFASQNMGPRPDVPGPGVAHIVYGKASGFAASLNLANLGSGGFHLTYGSMAFDASVWGVGDVNGDGLDDIAVSMSNGSGTVYVVYGRAGNVTTNINLATLTSDQGFIFKGGAADTRAGLSVRGADMNGDGASDLLVGGWTSPVTGVASGVFYIVYGDPGPLNFVGTGVNDTVTGRIHDDTISGGSGNDVLYGMAGDDLLDGGDLSDLLYGGDGADDILGGGGGDIIYGDAGDDEIDGGDGNDKLFGGTGADNLNGGTGNDRLDGESNVDTLRGGAGNDTLDGGLGADFMYGGADNDIYIVDDANDRTIELPNEGYDIVRTTLSWLLADNVEALELQGLTNASGTGNSAANRLDGNGGDNVLSGMAGVDTINGNDGDDIIIGGQGNDLLRGGIGADTFRVDHAFSGALETDQIYDFSTAEGDIMDFRDLFAGTIQKVTAFNHTAGQMTLTFAAGITTVKLDIDGNGSAEYQVKINGDVTADWGGWLL